MPSDDIDPVTWKQFLHVQENPNRDEVIARQMFDQNKAEILARDWTWYRGHFDSDDEAKAAWLRQRLRYDCDPV
jgi:hypothetical protein